MRKHAYTGAPNTCLWCGRPIPERFALIKGPMLLGGVSGKPPAPPAAGEVFNGRRVRAVEPYVKSPSRRWRPAQKGEPDIWAYRVFFDPPLMGGVSAFSDPHEPASPPGPVFDIPACARQYGRWAAGRDLANGTAAPVRAVPESTFRVYRAQHIHKPELHKTFTAPNAHGAALAFGKEAAAKQHEKDGHHLVFLPAIFVVDEEDHVQVFNLRGDNEVVYTVEPFKTKQVVF